MHGRDRQCELNGGIGAAKYELPTTKDIFGNSGGPLLCQIANELSGGECAQELWVPGDMGEHIWAVR